MVVDKFAIEVVSSCRRQAGSAIATPREVLGSVYRVAVSQSAGKWFVSIARSRNWSSRNILRLPQPVWIRVSSASPPCRTGEVLGELQPLKEFPPTKTGKQSRGSESP